MHDMHLRPAAIFGQVLDDRMVAFLLRYEFHQLRDDVTQLVHLALLRNVVCNPARILDVLLTVEHLPDRFRFGPHRIPHMHGKDQAVSARIVVEDRLGRRIGKNAAVPIKLAVDANGRNAGGSAPDAITCRTDIAVSRLSK